jgi:hypothetical protein
MGQNGDALHQDYKSTLGRTHDFRIIYELEAEFVLRGVAKIFQGVRPIFCYGKLPCDDQYHIWPEFETPNRVIIKRSDVPIRVKGTARMWIIYEEEVEQHLRKLTPGTECYMYMDNRLLARCLVIE